MIQINALSLGRSLTGKECVLLDDQPIVIARNTFAFRVGHLPKTERLREDLRLLVRLNGNEVQVTAILHPDDSIRQQCVPLSPEDLGPHIENATVH